MAKEEHRRVQKVGIEGEDPASRVQDAEGLGQGRPAVRHVMEHAAEGDAVVAGVAKRKSERVGLEPDGVREALPGEPQSP